MRTRRNRYQQPERSQRIVRQRQRSSHADRRRTNEDAGNQNDLQRIYNYIKSVPSYSSKIAEFLRQNETSSLHKRIRRKFKRRKTVTYYPYDICMADLAFYNNPDYVRANNGVKYILGFIDVFTKTAVTIVSIIARARK